MIENWKDIPGYEGFYRASNQGYIKSLPRLTSNGRRRKGKILKPSSAKRHLRVSLSKNNNIKTYGVHRLVLETFVGPCPPGMECCHNDGNPKNNKLTNLRWDTHSNNVKDAIGHGTHVDNRGEKHGLSKLIEEQVLGIHKLHEKGWTYKQLAKEYSVTQGTIGKIIRRERWAHIY